MKRAIFAGLALALMASPGLVTVAEDFMDQVADNRTPLKPPELSV